MNRLFTEKKVLYVEHDLIIRDTITHFLQDLGLTVITASSGEQGLEHYYHFQPDIIVADLNLPDSNDIDGMEMLRAIRKENPNIPAIILAGENNLDHIFELITINGGKYLLKPVNYDIFTKALLEAADAVELYRKLNETENV